jgi:hypothetical protein
LRAAAAELRKVGADGGAGGQAAARLAERYDNLADFREVAEIEREHLRGVHERVGSASITYVPYLSRDVYDFAALREIGGLLFDGSADQPPRDAPL